MAGYTKLFSTILNSSVWSSPDHVRIMWITMLAMSDADGYVGASMSGLAYQARMSRDRAEDAVAVLSNPDPDSRTEEDDGTRIIRVDGGWQIINYAKYRALGSKEYKRERDASRKALYRERLKGAAKADLSHDVPLGHDIAEAEAEAEAKNNNNYVVDPAPSAPAVAEVAPPVKAKRTKRKSGQEVKLSELSGTEQDQEYFQSMWDCWPKEGIRQVERFGRMVETKVPFNRGSRAMAERAFQKIIDSGKVSALELYASGFCYAKHARTEGWCQHVSTFLGPEKATWREWLDAGRKLIADHAEGGE